MDTFEGNPKLFFYGVARNLIKEDQKKAKSYISIDDVDVPAEAPQLIDDEDDDLREECLRDCLKELTREKRELILAYYAKEKQPKIEDRARLAQQIGVSIETLRVRMCRIRASLEECIGRRLNIAAAAMKRIESNFIVRGTPENDKMSEESVTNTLARRFLLGDVDDLERERIERLFISESEINTKILLAEDDLIEDYLENSLTPSDRDKFLGRYGYTAAERQKLRITKSIKEYAAAEARLTQTAPAIATGARFWPRFDNAGCCLFQLPLS